MIWANLLKVSRTFDRIYLRRCEDASARKITRFVMTVWGIYCGAGLFGRQVGEKVGSGWAKENWAICTIGRTFSGLGCDQSRDITERRLARAFMVCRFYPIIILMRSRG